MMQFTETLPPLYHQEISPNFTTTTTTTTKNKIHRTRPWPCGGKVFPTTISSSNSTASSEANSIEQLLVHCANAIQTNDATLAQQILWVLNNLVPHADAHHDSNQRLAAAFLRALASRAANSILHNNTSDAASSTHNHKLSIIELATFVDLTPWHRFGFTAANTAIIEAIEGFSTVHIVDLSSTHCMQIPTLIDLIAIRCFEGQRSPPLVKLTVAAATATATAKEQNIPPVLDLSYEELCKKLVNFAKSKNITLEFRVVQSSYSDGFSSLIQDLGARNFVHPGIEEALVVNCHMMLHYIPDETLLSVSSPTSTSPLLSYREMFIKAIRCLEPTIVILVDEDADFTSESLVTRLRSAFNYLWIPYDTVDTFLAHGSEQRQWYEASIGWKIENVIAHEGVQRVERLEPKSRWAQRMRNANFRGVCFSEEGVSEVKSMLDEHAAGWGLKREDEDLVLTWKGHNVVFANAWIPTS